MKPKFLDLAAALLILSASLLLAVPSFFSYKAAESFTVDTDGTVQTLPLTKDGEYTFVSNGHHLTVTVNSGEVTVSEADCSDGLCVAMPAIKRAGETIVCLPARTVISISGKGAEVDGIAG